MPVAFASSLFIKHQFDLFFVLLTRMFVCLVLMWFGMDFALVLGFGMVFARIGACFRYGVFLFCLLGVGIGIGIGTGIYK